MAVARPGPSLDRPPGLPYDQKSRGFWPVHDPPGAVAQLGERGVRNAEVGSSILLRSIVMAAGAWMPFVVVPFGRGHSIGRRADWESA